MGTIAEDLTGIKNIEDTLTSNKVATFAYTEQAYQNNDANGVTLYDVDKPQNIPVAQPNILKVNETILAKGWRSQASSIPRMLMNHFLGRCSYNLNKINDLMSSLLTTLLGHLGTANGIATLDASGKLPSGQIPTSVVQSVNSHSPTNGNVDISKSDVGLGSVANTGDSATPAQGGTEKFTTGGAYSMKSDLEQSISNTQSDLEQSISGVSSNLSSHVNNDSNPHNVTKAQVGLGNVVNTGDSATPVSGGTDKFTTGGAYSLERRCAPRNHADTVGSYGTASIDLYGHVKLGGEIAFLYNDHYTDGDKGLQYTLPSYLNILPNKISRPIIINHVELYAYKDPSTSSPITVGVWTPEWEMDADIIMLSLNDGAVTCTHVPVHTRKKLMDVLLYPSGDWDKHFCFIIMASSTYSHFYGHTNFLFRLVNFERNDNPEGITPAEAIPN